MCFRRSNTRLADAKDGSSHTYLVAEGYLDAHHYASVQATNDDQSMYASADRDTLRVTHPAYPPLPDTPGVASDHSFGSAHPSGFHAAFCDGSVRRISYAIDYEIHRRLGNCRDHLPVDLSAL
jgi:prepilin-type processing-associated H-X9-DG protein